MFTLADGTVLLLAHVVCVLPLKDGFHMVRLSDRTQFTLNADEVGRLQKALVRAFDK